MLVNVVSPYKNANSTVWTGNKLLTKELTLCELIEGLWICLSLSTTVFIINLLQQHFFFFRKKILERNLKITSYYNSHNAGLLWNTRRRISKDYRVVTGEWEGCKPCCTSIVKIRPVQNRCFRSGGAFWLICFIYWGKIRAQYGTFLHLNSTFNFLESNSLGKPFRLPPNGASWRFMLS